MIDYEFKTGQVFTKMESQEPLHDQIKISMSLFRLYLMSGSFNPWKIPLWSSWAFLVKRVLIRRTRAIFGFLAAAGVIATVALGDNSTFAPHPSYPINASPPPGKISHFPWIIVGFATQARESQRQRIRYEYFRLFWITKNPGFWHHRLLYRLPTSYANWKWRQTFSTKLKSYYMGIQTKTWTIWS